MSDPWQQHMASDDEPGRTPAYVPRYAPPARRDNTPYMALIGVGAAVALFVVIYAVSTSRPTDEPAPAQPLPSDARQAPPAQAPPTPSAETVAAAGRGRTPRAVSPATAPRRGGQPAESAWTIEKAVRVSGAIDEQGRLRITAANLSPGRIRYVNVEVRTSEKENANRTVTLSGIDPGKDATVVVDFPELRRRDDPRAVPEMYVWEGEFDTR